MTSFLAPIVPALRDPEHAAEDAPKPLVQTMRIQMRVLSAAPRPVDALRALAALSPALLDSRGEHPEARYAVVAFRPLVELELDAEGVVERRSGCVARRHSGPMLEHLQTWFDRFHVDAPPDLPFAGGWVGYLGHEAAAALLGTPPPAPVPPARPALPLGVFRLYTDALIIDRHTGSAVLLANDFDDEHSAERRLDEAERRILAPPNAAPMPECSPDVERTMERTEFEDAVRRLQTLVRDGDCFQANLTTSFAFAWRKPPSWAGLASLYDAYAAANPGPWGGFFDTPSCTLLSASPELLFALDGGRLRLRPIAGTRPRGATPQDDERLAEELRADPKERAEHAMLVDLARNDAASVCIPGTVHVPNLAGIERYRHVMHLVSEVEGRIRPSTRVVDILRAVFPGGTVTGAPKRRAVQRIAELEGSPRGPYTGALGFVSLHGPSQWNLLIRTLVATPTHLVAHAGCGIVAGSRPEREHEELLAKARAQIDAALGRSTPADPKLACGSVERGQVWRFVPSRSGRIEARVLLVDCDDSFVHNLADGCAQFGASTHVVNARDPVDDAWRFRPTHLVLSPGPGRPEDFPRAFQHLARAKALGIPVLGVCLGHQLLAEAAGAAIVRHPETVHGRASDVRPTKAAASDPLMRAWTGRRGARYHSLVAVGLPSSLIPLATLGDGAVMAVRHRDRPWWGLQFHPESILTERGLELLGAFLEVQPHRV